MNEEWRDVVGYEGIYQVSDLGRVRRVKRGTGTLPGKILKPSLAGGTTIYLRVMLYNGSHKTRKQYFVHVLVAEAFLGPKPEGHEVNHKNGDKLDPRLDNLEYLTKSGNRIHAMEVLGVGPDNTGSCNGKAILAEDDALQIRRLYATGQFYLRELASQFNVSRTVITNIVNHRTWKHVGGPQSSITYRPLKPTFVGSSKLNPDRVREIRFLFATKQYSRKQLASMFGVSYTHIKNVINRKTWADID